MNRLNGIKDFFRDNLYAALAVALIVVIGAGYVLFYSSTIAPGLANRDSLIAQLADARKSLVDTRAVSEQNPATLQARWASAQATLTAASSFLLSPAQTSQITDALYQYASASHVSITDLQMQPTTNPSDKNVLSITTARLQVQGDSHQLANFVSRIKESATRGFVINNLSITADKAASRLTMDVTLYTLLFPATITPANLQTSGQPASSNSPAASSAQLLPTSSPQPAATSAIRSTPVPPTPTWIPPTPPPSKPAPQTTYYVVHPADTLYAVARRNGVTMEAIMAANGLSTYNIFVGQQLIIPVH